MKLASFDIFDTVLIRKCGDAENIFYLLAHDLYPDNRAMQEAFLLWRRRTPETLKPVPGRAEVTLDELYSCAASAGFGAFSKDELVRREQKIESDNLICNASVRRLIDRKRTEGCKIAFISDMYLDSGFLRDILTREKCFLEGDEIFISSECGFRKDTGKLFEYVQKTLAPVKWFHYGDNRKSDVKIPRRYGIVSSRIDTAYTDVEKELLNTAKNCSDPYTLKLCAGLSRAARLSAGNSAEHILAADYVAPSYLPYVEYLRKRCHENGVQRIYFLSRDGWILHQTAECCKFGGVELRDFFVSRRSLMLPYLACDFSPESYLKIVDRHTLLRRNVSHMLWQLNLTRAQVASEFDCTFDYEKITSKQQEQDFLTKLFSGKLGMYLKALAEEQYDLCVKYFRQSGLFDDVPYVFVDVGWLGTSRLMINTILRR
ncbi:MAG: HAD-IA family hydrolase, partial [Lentisphaeria bacterium]|nr:HAD-IA family hydrolase [Lentisphaeria bacterium]